MDPEAFEAWKSLQSSIVRSMGMRSYELVTLAASLDTGTQLIRCDTLTGTGIDAHAWIPEC